MDNHQRIFGILSHYREFCPQQISIQANLSLSAGILLSARNLIRKKPLRSWSSIIPEVALKEANVFAAFWPTVLLAGPNSNHIQQFWNGGGEFLSNLNPGQNHLLCGYAELSFTIFLSEKPFIELQPLLEKPENSTDVKRNAKILDYTRNLRDQLLRSLPSSEDSSPP